MIMIATGCDSDVAFAYLRRYSQEANMNVHDIAHRSAGITGEATSSCRSSKT